MAIRRLFNAMQIFAAGEGAQAVRNDLATGTGPVNRRQSSPGVRVGRVMAVGAANLVVQHAGRTDYVAQTTDEPLRAGQAVWMSPVRNGGFVVHGSRK